ncbi:spexin prohormone 2 isoform X2 [Notolabrus celidotus]|uniref:spexin prohormone 2 isoform X2 n=1 Tax=Notolabrus celidotus TaxID=1203425 RepID=UPI00148F4D52|nr:spexin prohormone 2 isoform X2 [Notolabrus celidotus]
MNSPGTELNSSQREREQPETDNSPSKERDGHFQPDPVGTPVWGGLPSAVCLPTAAVCLPAAAPFPQQQGVHTVMMDPLSFGFHGPCQYFQCQTNSDYLQPSCYHLLPGPAPGPSDSSHVSSVSAPWFSYDPVLYSKMMPAGDHQQFLREMTEFAPHYTQPMLCNIGEAGQEVLVNPCETGPVFHTLKPAPINREDRLTQGGSEDQLTNNLNMFGTDHLPPPYEQPSCPLYEYQYQAPSVQPEDPPQRALGARRPCHCTRSQCLKLYCECFANGLMCMNCECSNCFNNVEHVGIRQKAMELRSGRNPGVFKTKIVRGRSGHVKGWHNKGCTCKRSGCLKNYCECYEANVLCTSSCKCDGCRNFDDGTEMGTSKKTIGDNDSCPKSVITLGVVKAVCGCLLAQAKEVEAETQSSVAAEQKVLEEFGECLTQIVKAMFK